MGRICFSEVPSYLFCIVIIERLIVCAPCGQPFYFLSVCCLIIPTRQSQHGRIICELYDVVGVMCGCAVVSQRGVEQRTKHAALQISSAQCDDVGGNAAPPNQFRPLCPEVQDPIE